jgi:hypothetical protein
MTKFDFSQPETFLDDIRNFTESREIICKIYYDLHGYLLPNEAYADIYWLVSDILLYMKKNKHSSYSKMIKSYNKKMSKTDTIYNELGFFWGHLTPIERDNFIKIRTPKKK